MLYTYRCMMKRTFFLFVALLCSLFAVKAQDLIVKVDATQIKAKVLEIDPDAVRYKRSSNLEGPTYVLPVAQIHYILYANGEKDVFEDVAANKQKKLGEAAPQNPAAITQKPSTASLSVKSEEQMTEVAKMEVSKSEERMTEGQKTVEQVALASKPKQTDASNTSHTMRQEPVAEPYVPHGYVLKRYEIGEYYDEDGLRGVVCKLSDDGLHGLILSVDELYLHWNAFSKDEQRAIATLDRKDGAVNMATVAAYIEENHLSWSDFPAFDWCRKLGEGWYLPSIDEMLMVGYNYNGQSRVTNNRVERARFNDALRNHGGKRMDRMAYYFTSTETNDKEVLTTHMSLDPPYVVARPKYEKWLVRAVHKF